MEGQTEEKKTVKSVLRSFLFVCLFDLLVAAWPQDFKSAGCEIKSSLGA